MMKNKKYSFKEENSQTTENKTDKEESAFEVYKKGMDMIKDCNKEIDKVEKQIIVLQNTDSDVEE